MADIQLTDIQQTQYDAAERYIIELTRASDPNLDLRAGTVIREKVIRPAAMFYALDDLRFQELEARTSLIALSENPNASADDVNKQLSNFNMTMNAGKLATGYVKIIVDAARVYTIGAEFSLAVLDGRTYTTDAAYTVRTSPNAGELALYPTGLGTYYFILPVVAAGTGTAYDLAQSVAMTPTTSFYGFVSATSYTAFSGGADAETTDQAIARIPSALSHRSLTDRTAIEARLRDQFSATLDIQAVGVQGMGDAAQLRDKHNINGISVGSRADVYVRTFLSPVEIVLTKTGTLVSPNTYQLTIEAADAPGFSSISGIYEKESTGLATYAFEDSRFSTGLTGTRHDIDSTNSVIETAFSKYQGSTITVYGVQADSNEHEFSVIVYCAPGIGDIQDFVDSDAVRNIEADIIVRSPLVCIVECSATVYVRSGASVDTAVMKSAVVDYVNSMSFSGVLSRSGIASVLLSFAGVSRVDMGTDSRGMLLSGAVRDAAGTWHSLTGDSLNIDTVENAATLLTGDTVVFSTSTGRIYLTVVTE